MSGEVVIAGCLLLSLGLNGLLIWLYNRSQRDWLQMFRQREGLELPAEQELAQNVDVVRTAKDMLERQQVRRRQRKAAFSVPLPGTDWMKRGKEL